MEFTKKFSLLLVIISRLLLRVSSNYNYIVNGDFEQPAMAAGTYSTVATGWDGTFFNLWNDVRCAGFSGQCMDLQGFAN